MLPTIKGPTLGSSVPYTTSSQSGVAVSGIDGFRRVPVTNFAAYGIGMAPPIIPDSFTAPDLNDALGTPMSPGVHVSPHMMSNPTVAVNRRVAFMPEFSNVRGAILPNSIGVLYLGYTASYMDSTDTFTHDNRRVEEVQYGIPQSEVLLTLPMANSILVSLARKAQLGELKEEYDENFVNRMFVVDGVIQTVTGDEAREPRNGYGRRQAYASVARCARVVTMNIWETPIQPGATVSIGVKKFDPRIIISEKIPYSANPESQSDGTIESTLLEMVNESDISGTPQWVYQFVPLPPYTHGSGVELSFHESSLLYKNEYGILNTINPIVIGKSERTAYHAASSMTQRIAPPACVTSTLKMASLTKVEMYASVVF